MAFFLYSANFVHCGNIFFGEKWPFLSEWLSYATYFASKKLDNNDLITHNLVVLFL